MDFKANRELIYEKIKKRKIDISMKIWYNNLQIVAMLFCNKLKLGKRGKL